MAQDNDPAEAALRLEQALDRIARAARAAPSPPAPAVDTTRIAARLDALIAELRAVLAGLSAG